MLKFNSGLILYIIVLLAGCSTRPLVDDVVQLSAYQILSKIRCEAKNSVSNIYFEEGFQELQGPYDAAKKKLKIGDKALDKVKKKKDKLAKLREQLKYDLDQAENNLNKKAEEIKIVLLDNPELSNDEATELSDELNALKKIRSRINLRILEYKRSLRKINKKENEIKQWIARGKKAISEKFEDLIDFRSQRIVTQFNTEITETNTGTGEGSFKFPIHLGTFTIGVKAGDTKERFADRDIMILVKFSDLMDLDCANYPEEDPSSIPMHYPIKGNIGVHAVIKSYWEIAKEAKFTSKQEAYVDVLRFTTTLNASTQPSFTVSPTLRETLTGSFDIGATRKDIHEVSLGLSRGAKGGGEEEKITRVLIVKDPTELNISR